MENNNTKDKSKIKICIACVIIAAIVVFYLNSIGVFAIGDTQGNFDKAFNDLAGLISKISYFLLGVSIISSFGKVIVHLIRLGAAGGNPQARAKILQDMLTTIICTALLGSISLVIQLIIVLGRSL